MHKYAIISVTDKFEPEIFRVLKTDSLTDILKKYLTFKYERNYSEVVDQITSNSYVDMKEWCRYQYNIKIISEVIEL